MRGPRTVLGDIATTLLKIHVELREIRRLLEREPAPNVVPLNTPQKPMYSYGRTTRR